jgi:hypothetical protein
VFGGLAAPTLEDLVGQWDGEFIGRPALRRLTVALTAPTRMRGWCGKLIDDSGNVHNLVRRGRRVVRAVDATASSGTSLLDGKPAIVVDYSKTSRPPGCWVRGELRWLVEGSDVLGVLLVPVRGHLLGPLPFRLTGAALGRGLLSGTARALPTRD